MNQADKSKEIKIKQYILSSEDLKNSALFTVCTSVLLWFIKAIYHCYWMGKFSVYHIEKCYIEINSDNTILEVLYVVLGIIVVGICNYLHYNIVKKSGNDEKWKRRIGFYCIQSLFAFVFIIIYSNISMNEFWKETTIVQKLAIYVFSIILCFIINICSILESTSKEYSSKKEKKILNEKKIWIAIVIAVTIAMVSFIVMSYAWGRSFEQDKTGYKILIEDNIEIKKDGNETYFYPVVYENKDYYILSKFNYNNKQFIYEYQKIIRKDDQATLYIQDIYNFKMKDYE